MKRYRLFLGSLLFIAVGTIATLLITKYLASHEITVNKIIAHLEKDGMTVEVSNNNSMDLQTTKLTSSQNTTKFVTLTIDQNDKIKISDYESNNKMEEFAEMISKDGSSITNGDFSLNIDWVYPPHYYKKDKIIVFYTGINSKIKRSLEQLMGEPFAGY